MSSLSKRKLLIVDDSAFMRKLISDFFKDSTTIEVIGTARNGRDAIQKIQELQPNVVTMDVEMPEMNGLEALKEIMTVCPVPVLMLSSTTMQGAENTLTAMDLGAVDFVAKTSGNISLDLHKIKDELVHKVEQAAFVQVSKLRKHSRPSFEPRVPTVQTASTQPKSSNKDWGKASKKIILMGTSTGGPRALQEVITSIAKTVDAPILVVQHMPAGFTKSLANRLNQLSEVQVKEAEQGDILQNGTVYIAPGGFHLKLRKIGMAYGIILDQVEPARAGHRPSVDVMFESVSQFPELDKIAVIMTGMGYDGSQGLKKLKATGNVVAIAESANTSIVYGMPKAAVETTLVDEIADINEIAQVVMKYM